MLFDRTIQNIKNLNRLREILKILFKYGFEDIVINTPLRHLLTEKQRGSWKHATVPVFELNRWERIRSCTEELGPTYIKLAQALSNRSDIIPIELTTELEKLQSDVPPFSSDMAQEIIEKEIGKPLSEIYSEFNPVPIGSASIGQVHRAKLKNGTEDIDVVIKVQRPNVQEQVETDLAIMYEIAKRVEAYLEKQGIPRITDVVTAFEKSMQRELDYGIEARNLMEFQEYYKDDPDLHIPKVFKEYSTPYILTMEFVNACKITDIAQLREWGLSTSELAEKGINIYLEQIFKKGAFHADPHPGNVLVLPNGQICLIDFGMVGRLMKRDTFALAGIFIGMAQSDARKMATSIRQLAIEDHIMNRRAFIEDLNDIIVDYVGKDLGESSLAEIATSLQKILFKHQVVLPGNIFLVLRALAILEGVGRQIHPNLNLYEHVKPFGVKVLKEQLSQENLEEEMLYRVLQFDEYARHFPAESLELIRKTRKGELEFQLNVNKLEDISSKLVAFSNSIILTLIIVGLLLSSSILFLSPHLQPSVMTADGYPYLSLIGFLLAFILIMALTWRIFREEK